MTATDVLNPTLFRSLVSEFGKVGVTHPGEPFKSRITQDLENQSRLKVDQHGEQYKVCCPYCRDRGNNLIVNHRYGTYHEAFDYPLNFLTTCFVRGCLKNPKNRDDLYERLGGDEKLARARIRNGTAVPADPSRLPASFERLDSLPVNHPVLDFLAGQNHDPNRLGRVFGMGYCPTADVLVANKRIIAPVRKKGEIIGWLAAIFKNGRIGFLSAPGMAAGKELYNLDRARKYDAVVIVPSPDWVWRVGTAATAPLMTLSPARLSGLLRKALPGRDLILVGTKDSTLDIKRLSEWLAYGHKGKTACVGLPASAVTATPSELREMLQIKAVDQGIELTFEKSV